MDFVLGPQLALLLNSYVYARLPEYGEAAYQIEWHEEKNKYLLIVFALG